MTTAASPGAPSSLKSASITSKASFVYPACAEQSTGPCALQTSSSDACQRLWPDIENLYDKRLCMCSNGYYNRSSECFIDCYGYGATTTDYSLISIEVALASVECESYSLAALSESMFYASLSSGSDIVSNSSLSAAASESLLSYSISGGGGEETTGVNSFLPTGSAASQGATGPSVVQATTSWAERPSATTAAQTGGAISRRGGVGRVMVSALVVLVLASAVYA